MLLIHLKIMKIYENTYKSNKVVKIPVNHLGEYNVQVNVFDKYNHIYSNMGLSSYNLNCKPIGYNIIVNQDKSNNTQDFYKFNRNGILLDEEELPLLINQKQDPITPMSYRIYDIQHDFENNTILYNNISYAIDTPKNNENI